MDRRHLSLARETDVRYDLLIPAEAEAVLLVEHEAATRWPRCATACGKSSIACGVARSGWPFDARAGRQDRDEIELYWRLAAQGRAHAVPPEGLDAAAAVRRGHRRAARGACPTFWCEMQNVLKRHQVTASLFGHAGHGQLHIRPFLDLAEPGRRDTNARAAGRRPVRRSAGRRRHDQRRARRRPEPHVRSSAGNTARWYDVFREVKRIFDPHNILNPGKIVGDDPDLLTRNLRPRPAVGRAVGTRPPASNAPSRRRGRVSSAPPRGKSGS